MFKLSQNIIVCTLVQNTDQLWINTLKKLLIIHIQSCQQIEHQNLLVGFIKLKVILIIWDQPWGCVSNVVEDVVDVVHSHAADSQFDLLFAAV